MSGPSVYLTWPTGFWPVPDNLPPALPPPVKERSFRSPFGIDKTLFNFVLRPELPLAFATVYILAVFSLNAYNRRRDHKPWWISQQPAFRYFVIVHNVVLALYSFATFAAMCRAIAHTWPDYVSEHPAASIADALCKLHGPRGLGDAASYNTTINIWESKNMLIRLGRDGNPDPTDVGRLWNEGLAFWGWIFYVSKFYEVIDTLIILAKGKRSATLQTYHHAGAMLCMWAGIRYMSPPIWMFVFINSAIHAMMYTYFTLSALGYRVPQGLKRTLTSLQIAQFVFGASYAALHLFVQYDIPVSTPYQIVSSVERAVSSVSSKASSVSSAVSSFVETPTATVDWINLAKKLLLRAAGEEGPAERIGQSNKKAIESAITSLAAPAADKVRKVEKVIEKVVETRWRTDWTRVNCIDTSGEAFAIYLNLLYLAPLTWLFARFFVKAYTQRGRPRTASQAARDALNAAKEARRDTRDRVEKSGIKVEDDLARSGSQSKKKGKAAKEELKKDVQAVRDGTFDSDTVRRASEKKSEASSRAQDAMASAREEVQKIIKSVEGSSSDTGSRLSEKASEKASEASSQAQKAMAEGKEEVQGIMKASKESLSNSETSSQDNGRPASKNGKHRKAHPPKLERRTPPPGKSPQQPNSPRTPQPKSPGGGLFRSPDMDASAARSGSPTKSTGKSVEPAAKQDTNLTETEAIRPAPLNKDGGEDDGAEGTTSLSESAQDEVLDASQPLRPDPEEDTDAMGRSGVDVGDSS